MEIEKISKKQYVALIKSLRNPFNCIASFIRLNFERVGINGDAHDEIMNYIIKFVNVNDEKINEILTNSPQYFDIKERSNDFILLTKENEPCWEQKKGLFYTFELNNKLFIIHQYNDRQNCYSIKCSFL